MERKIIFRDTVTGEELVMPVTPKEYQIEHGRRQNTETLHITGDVTTPGAAVLLDEEPEFLLPAHDYPFNQPGTVTNPFYYLEKLEKWSDAGTVLRYVVAGTPVNAPVRLGPIRFREQDGTNDVYCVVPVRGVRQLQSVEVEIEESAVPLAARAVEADPVKPQTYVVVFGDTLGGICKRFYGDNSLAAALAKVNGVKNVNLISVGQVLTIPALSDLEAVKVTTTNKTTTPAAAVTISFAGVSTLYGKLSVTYTKEGGGAGSAVVSKTVPKQTVKAKAGSAVVLLVDKDSKHRVAYFTVNGKLQTSSVRISVTADKDLTVEARWGA